MFQNGTFGTTGPEMWFPEGAFENELGVQEPVGFWDPVGFTADGDVTSFKRRRTVELKHGRISMLATMGYITPEITGKFPGYLSNSAALKFADVPTGLAAIAKVPALGWAQIVAYCGFCELSAGSDDWKTGTPGDYGFKVLTSSDPAEREKKLAAEIANGRLAMMAERPGGPEQGASFGLGPDRLLRGHRRGSLRGQRRLQEWYAGRLWVESADVRRSCCERRQVGGRAGEWQARDDGHHGHVLPRRLDRVRLGRLGVVHRLAFAVSVCRLFQMPSEHVCILAGGCSRLRRKAFFQIPRAAGGRIKPRAPLTIIRILDIAYFPSH